MENRETIRNARNELSQYGGLMTPYERQKVREQIDGMVERASPSITREVVYKHNTAIEGYQRAQKGVADARIKESQRWETQKMLAELELVGKRIDAALNPLNSWDGDPSELIAKEYASDTEGNDIYRKRAWSELLLSKADKLPKESKERGALIAKAKTDLASVRRIPEMDAAEQKKAEALKRLMEAREGLVDAHTQLYNSSVNLMLPISPFEKELNRVEIQQNGEIRIYDPGSPEASGVVMREVNNEG